MKSESYPKRGLKADFLVFCMLLKRIHAKKEFKKKYYKPLEEKIAASKKLHIEPPNYMDDANRTMQSYPLLLGICYIKVFRKNNVFSVYIFLFLLG